MSDSYWLNTEPENQIWNRNARSIPSDLLTGGESSMDTKFTPYTPIPARSSSSAMSAKTSALYIIGQMDRMPTVW